MAGESVTWTWNDVVARLRDEPIDTVVQIAVSAIEDPLSVGLQPMPANADGRPVYGAVLDQQIGILVQVSGENYEARLCRLPQPAASPPPPPVLSQQAASSPQSALPVVRQSTDLSPRSSQSILPQLVDAAPAPSVPVLVESRTELVLQRQREPTSLASFPAEQPGPTILATTLVGSLLGLAFGGPKGALAGALIGGGAGLASIAVSTAVTSPATAFTAQTMFLALAAASLGGAGGARVLRLAPPQQGALPPRRDDDAPPPKRRLPRKK